MRIRQFIVIKIIGMIIVLVFENRVLRKVGPREMRKQGNLKYRGMIKVRILFVPSKTLFNF